MGTKARPSRLLRVWDAALLVATLGAAVWLAALAQRAGRLVPRATPGVSDAAVPSPAAPAAMPRVEVAAPAAEFDGRLDRVERVIAERQAKSGEPDDPHAGVESPPTTPATLSAMSAWFAPFAADEVLADLERELALSPAQRPEAEAALCDFFGEYYGRLAGAYEGREWAGDPAARDLSDALENRMRALLTPEQFQRFLDYRERRK